MLVKKEGATEEIVASNPTSNTKTINNPGVAQLVRAPDLGSGGRKFESCHLDHNLYFREKNTPYNERK